jgi:hypothetical protein
MIMIDFELLSWENWEESLRFLFYSNNSIFNHYVIVICCGDSKCILNNLLQLGQAIPLCVITAYGRLNG